VSEVDMPRLALWSLLLSLLLCGVGFLSAASVWFEVVRMAGAFFLSAGVVLLLVNHARTPEPPEK
jgi:hypothetical protein